MEDQSRQTPGTSPTLGCASRPDNQRRRLVVLICMLGGAGLLAAFGVSDLTCRHEDSRSSFACAAIDPENGPIATALNLYKLNTTHLPRDLSDLCTQPAGERGWAGPYIADPLKLNDPWDMPYQYRSPGHAGRAYDVWSCGPDKQCNTNDDITSWSQH